jgi:hypothetical protein
MAVSQQPRDVGYGRQFVDRWVGDGVAPEQKPAAGADETLRNRRSADLHRRIKAMRREGLKMADVLREMLETRFPAKS